MPQRQTESRLSTRAVLDRPYYVALVRVIDYLRRSGAWEAERAAFEWGDEEAQAGHIFPAFQALQWWLQRKPIDLRLGSIAATEGAWELLDENEVMQALERHRVGDWGDRTEAEWGRNNLAAEFGRRVVSRYHNQQGLAYLVVTEGDRSETNFLLPEEHGG